jgi:predicted DsbA family dithiol-disulfide isomerase
MNFLKIDLYTEISCPWCIIGQHRLDKTLTEHFPDLRVDIEHHPVILMANCPPEGIRITDLLAARYGVTDPAAAWVRPHAQAHQSGLELDLSLQEFAYSTRDAHTLIRLARNRGSQHALASALSQAYFMEAKNISDARVLAEIASRHGFDREEALTLVTDPEERRQTDVQVERSFSFGVRSVPHFVLNKRVTFTGGVSEEDILGAIVYVLSPRCDVTETLGAHS